MEFSVEIEEIIQRIYRLKDHFRVGVPEDIVTLRKRIHESNITGKAGAINNFDLFHRVGIVFSHYDRPITMGELSHDLEVPLSTATRIMDWLVKNGYAHRLPDPEDRRIVRVALTTTGLDTFQTVNKFVLERIEHIISIFSPEECETFLKLLRKLLDALEKES